MTSPKDERSELVEDLVSRIARGELESQRGSFGPFDSLSAFCAWLRRRRISSIIHEGRKVMTVEIDEGGSPDPDCQQAADMLASLEPQAGMEWHPIETAPKDGTRIQLWHQMWKGPLAAEYHSGCACPWWEITKTTRWPDEAFTHWQPLPAPPGTPSEQGSGLREALEEARQFVVIHGPATAFPDMLAKIDDALGAS